MQDVTFLQRNVETTCNSGCMRAMIIFLMTLWMNSINPSSHAVNNLVGLEW